MKLIVRRIRRLDRQPQTTPYSGGRRGALFHYYMVYLLMTGSVMATAGVCLHAVFNADYKDEMLMRHLQTLTRLEQTLRTDIEQSAEVGLIDGVLQCRGDGLLLRGRHNVITEQSQMSRIEWTCQGSEITRHVFLGESVTETNPFRFGRGVEVQLIAGEGREIRVEITDAAIAHRGIQSKDRGVAGRETSATDGQAETGEDGNGSISGDGMVRGNRVHIIVFGKSMSTTPIESADPIAASASDSNAAAAQSESLANEDGDAQ